MTKNKKSKPMTATLPKKKIKKEKVQPAYVHIHAKCFQFEIHEQVLESKAVGRLLEIKEAFNPLRYEFPDDKLVVKTVVVNPKMF